MITATCVTNDPTKMEQMALALRGLGVELESLIYATMRQLCKSYCGGSWNYYLLDNGALFMAPEEEQLWHLQSESMASARLGSEQTGVVVSLFAIGRMLDRRAHLEQDTKADAESELLFDKHQKLMDYSRQYDQPIRMAITQLLD